MLLEAFQRLGGKTFSEEVAAVVVRDRLGNPLIVACELSPNMYDVAKVGDPDFDAVLQALGIDKTVIVTDLTSPPPQRGDRCLLAPGGTHGT